MERETGQEAENLKLHPRTTSPGVVWIKKKKKTTDKATLFTLESHLGLKCHHYCHNFALGHGDLYMCPRDRIFPSNVEKK